MTDKYGPETATVDAFLRHLKLMTPEQWAAARVAARVAAWDAARVAAGDAARVAAWDATNEIQGAKLMRERGQPFFFLPLFGFADPEAVLTADLKEQQP
jgi:hypothetical protein